MLNSTASDSRIVPFLPLRAFAKSYLNASELSPGTNSEPTTTSYCSSGFTKIWFGPLPKYSAGLVLVSVIGTSTSLPTVLPSESW